LESSAFLAGEGQCCVCLQLISYNKSNYPWAIQGMLTVLNSDIKAILFQLENSLICREDYLMCLSVYLGSNLSAIYNSLNSILYAIITATKYEGVVICVLINCISGSEFAPVILQSSHHN